MVTTNASCEPSPGDLVVVGWGPTSEIQATVIYVYGSANRRHALLALTPEVTGDLVSEETTLSVPVGEVKLVEVA